MIDMLNAGTVEIEIDETGKLWINVDGACQLRIGKAENIILDHNALHPAFPRRTVIINGERVGSIPDLQHHFASPDVDDAEQNTPRGG
jgi:hypothetical protein